MDKLFFVLRNSKMVGKLKKKRSKSALLVELDVL